MTRPTANLPEYKTVVLPPFDVGKEVAHWVKVGDKTEGSNESGDLGGFYKVTCGDVAVCVFLKQDPSQDKNIAEVLASQLMRFISVISGDPDSIADVDYVETEKGIYIASLVFDGFRPLYQDAHLAFHLPNTEGRNQVKNWHIIPEERASFLLPDACVTWQMGTGRYKNIEDAAKRLVMEDVDTNPSNQGAVPIQPTAPHEFIPMIRDGNPIAEELSEDEKKKNPGINFKLPLLQPLTEKDLLVEGAVIINIEGKSYKKIYSYQLSEDLDLDNPKEYCVVLPKKTTAGKTEYDYRIIPANNNTKVVQIDFGAAFGAFGLFHRTFDELIHVPQMTDFLRYFPSRKAPPAYHKQLPDTVTHGHKFFNVLARFSVIPNELITSTVNDEVKRMVELYSSQSKLNIVRDFANRIGVSGLSVEDSKDNLTAKISSFITDKLLAKQKHARQLFLEHYCRISRQEQNNCLNFFDNYSHTTVEEIKAKKQLTQEDALYIFYKSIEQEPIFSSLRKIERLEVVQSHQGKLNALKSSLNDEICRAYLRKDNIGQENVLSVCEDTTQLLAHYENTIRLMNSTPTTSDKISYYLEFRNKVLAYQNKICNLTLPQSFLAAALTMTGVLLGAVIGAALGLAAGAVIGSGFGSVAPIFGNIAGAIAGGSIVGVVTAIKGAGFGAMLASAAAAYLCGGSGAYLGARASRHLLFSRTQRACKELSQDLLDEVTPEFKPQSHADRLVHISTVLVKPHMI